MCQNIFNKHYLASFTKQPLSLETKQVQKWNYLHWTYKWFGTAIILHLKVKVQHRITECLGLERPFKGHIVQLLSTEQGHLQLHLIAQSPTHPDLSKSGAFTKSLHNLRQCFTTLIVKHFFLVSSLNLLSFRSKPLPLVLSWTSMALPSSFSFYP